jgi:hypothetical protein
MLLDFLAAVEIGRWIVRFGRLTPARVPRGEAMPAGVDSGRATCLCKWPPAGLADPLRPKISSTVASPRLAGRQGGAPLVRVMPTMRQ